MKDGVAVSDDKEMANILMDQYSSVLRMPREEVTSEFVEKLVSEGDTEKVMDSIVVNPVAVREAIAEISNVSASGPDGVPASLLINTKYAILKNTPNITKK